jgi:hypothetical protein
MIDLTGRTFGRLTALRGAEAPGGRKQGGGGATPALTLLAVAALPPLCWAMKLERGYFAFGGEWLLPLLPAALGALRGALGDFAKEARKGGRGDGRA